MVKRAVANVTGGRDAMERDGTDRLASAEERRQGRAKVWIQAWRSGLSVDQRTQHLIGALDHAGAELGAVLTDFQLNQLLGDLADGLRVAEHRRGSRGDGRSGLLDALLAALIGAQSGTEKITGDLHGGSTRCQVASIQADASCAGKALFRGTSTARQLQGTKRQVEGDLLRTWLVQARHTAETGCWQQLGQRRQIFLQSRRRRVDDIRHPTRIFELAHNSIY